MSCRNVLLGLQVLGLLASVSSFWNSQRELERYHQARAYYWTMLDAERATTTPIVENLVLTIEYVGRETPTPLPPSKLTDAIVDTRRLAWMNYDLCWGTDLRMTATPVRSTRRETVRDGIRHAGNLTWVRVGPPTHFDHGRAPFTGEPMSWSGRVAFYETNDVDSKGNFIWTRADLLELLPIFGSPEPEPLRRELDS